MDEGASAAMTEDGAEQRAPSEGSASENDLGSSAEHTAESKYPAAGILTLTGLSLECFS